MAKICEHCGKTITFISNIPYYLTEDKVLCWNCASLIRDDIDLIKNVKSEEEYQKIKEKVIKNCKECFNEDITNYIVDIMEYDFQKSNGLVDVTEDDIEENSHSGMFSNIGGKIKALAQVVCWIGIIASVFAGFSMFANEDLILIGIVIMIVGSLISWVSSFALYGFGELIDNSKKILDLLKK